MFEVQPAIGPNSPLSGAAVVIRLVDVTDEEGNSEGEGVEQNEENADSFMPKSDMTTRTPDDYFVHKTRAMRSAHECSVTQTREKCACCARLVGCAVHSPVASEVVHHLNAIFLKNSEENCIKEAKAFTISDGRCSLPEAVNDRLGSFSLVPFLFLPGLFLPFFPLVSITQ